MSNQSYLPQHLCHGLPAKLDASLSCRLQQKWPTPNWTSHSPDIIDDAFKEPLKLPSDSSVCGFFLFVCFFSKVNIAYHSHFEHAHTKLSCTS